MNDKKWSNEKTTNFHSRRKCCFFFTATQYANGALPNFVLKRGASFCFSLHEYGSTSIFFFLIKSNSYDAIDLFLMFHCISIKNFFFVIVIR